MIPCFLDFFYASVVEGDPQDGPHRFQFLIWMLGGLLDDFAARQGTEPLHMAIELMSVDVEGQLPATLQTAVEAAQTTLASHMLARSGRQPWGIASTLSPEGLSQLSVGVHILLWLLCFHAREQVGDAQIIRCLLPHLVRILQLSADAAGMTLDAYTSKLWLSFLQLDAGLLTEDPSES